MREGLVIGFPNPSWDEFPGEVRAFLPKFISRVGEMSGGATLIPEDYGMRMNPGLNYGVGNIEVVSTDEEIYATSNMVISLKFPPTARIARMPESSLLMSMIHFATKPDRVRFLQQQQIFGISLDGIRDDHGQRLVADMKGSAWNALNTAFGYLEERQSSLLGRKVLKVLILGSGQMGTAAVDSAIHWGGVKLKSLPPIDVRCIGRSITEQNREYFLDLLENTDILIDATRRTQLLTPIIYNGELRQFPQDGVVVDLAADPYSPYMVKAIEGIPHGNLCKYIFNPSDPSYDQFVPDHIPHREKRLTFSCESWPAISPEKSIRHYESQLLPVLETLLGLGVTVSEMYELISKTSEHHLVRALYRGSLKNFAQSCVALN